MPDGYASTVIAYFSAQVSSARLGASSTKWIGTDGLSSPLATDRGFLEATLQEPMVEPRCRVAQPLRQRACRPVFQGPGTHSCGNTWVGRSSRPEM